jgi:hypothetical protein
VNYTHVREGSNREGEPSNRLMWGLRWEHFQEIYLKSRMQSKCKTQLKARNDCVIIITIIINISVALPQILNARSMIYGPGQCSQYSDILWHGQFRV